MRRKLCMLVLIAIVLLNSLSFSGASVYANNAAERNRFSEANCYAYTYFDRINAVLELSKHYLIGQEKEDSVTIDVLNLDIEPESKDEYTVYAVLDDSGIKKAVYNNRQCQNIAVLTVLYYEINLERETENIVLSPYRRPENVVSVKDAYA